MRLVPERDPLPRLLAFVYAPVAALLWIAVQRGWLWSADSYRCPLLEHTGVACLTCGGLRAVWALGDGRWGDALREHPLVVLAIVGLGIWTLYAVAATIAPRWRRSIIFTAGDESRLRRGVLLLLAATWAYQILRHF